MLVDECHDLNECLCIIELECINIATRTAKIEVCYNLESVLLTNDTSVVTFEITATIPTDILIKISGIVSPNSEIKIKKFWLDDFELNEKFLTEKIMFISDTGVITTGSKFITNGTAHVKFGSATVFSQVLIANQY